VTDELQGGDFSVVEGLDGFLFLGNYAGADVMRQFTDADAVHPSVYASWATALPQWCEYFEQRGIDFLALVVPDAYLVYADKLPPGTTPTPVPPYRRIEALLDARTRAHCVYVLDDLVAGRTEHDTYQTTDSHWSDFGAYLGYRRTMTTLAALRPDVEILPPDRIAWSERRAYGALGVRLTEERAERLRVAKVLGSTCRPTRNVMDELRGGYKVVEQDRPDLPTAVVFRDSFMTNAAQFFSESFRRVVYVTHSNQLFRDLIEAEKPDVVIFQAAERRMCLPVGDPALGDFRTTFGDLLLDDPAAVQQQVGSRSLLRAGDLAGALAANDKVLAMVVPTARLMLYRSRLLTWLERPDDALDALRTAFTLDPLDAPVAAELAKSLHQHGRLAEAAAAARWAARLEPHDVERWSFAISAALEAGDVAGARTLAGDALEQHDDQPVLRYLDSRALVAAGDFEAAETSIRSALADRPDDTFYLRQLASVLIRSEQWPEAEDCLARLRALEPNATDLAAFVDLVEQRLAGGGHTVAP